MTRFIPLVLASALAVLSTSCGCKQKPKVPALRSMPEFNHPSYNPTPMEPAPVITPSK